ncbi:LytR C-terminal domain-containing protein [Haloactinomyces albus]|uniref:LytR/CpsA/Psr regulator C-terminal domain-containing protein n=1 Tax=Haloactinomyces albus TaxID=1352928 RepID=A0AAE3ZCW4_9ACTN|nr:LytR C-terminal domain-containing protein [Haloactinomyces albus]MDR7301560.1 hypothetical protein [Haloactinomyces albus]
MTSGEPPVGPSATKLVGFVLIGLGVLAAVFGVATVVSGGTHSVAQSTSSTPPPSPTAATPASGASPAVPEPSAAPSPERTSQTRSPGGKPGTPGASPNGGRSTAVPAPGKPGQVAPAPDAPGRNTAGAGSDRRIAVRIYNNSMISGLAHRAAEDFRQAGYTVSEIGNYSSGRIPTTTIYYRPGTAEQQQAEAIGARFGARTEPRFDGITDASPGIIVIVTKNYDGAEPGK